MSDLKLFWGETSNSGGQWWASCTDMVCNVVLDRGVLIIVNLGESGNSESRDEYIVGL